MEKKKSQEALWTKPYLMLILVGIMTQTCFNMIKPTITKYAVDMGATTAVAGLIAGLFAVTSLVVRPFSGFMADRMNRKNMLILSTCVMGISAIGYSISNTVPMLLAFRILQGIAFAFCGTVNISMIASVVPRSRLGEGVGIYGLVNIVALAIGPSIGLSLGNVRGLGFSYLISGIFLFISAGIAALLPFRKTEKAVSTDRRKVHLDDLISVKVLPLALTGCLFCMSNGIIGSYLVLLGEIRQIDKISIYFTVNAVALVLIRPVVGRLSDKKYGLLMVFSAMLFDAMALILLSRSGSIGTVVLASLCAALGQGSGQPILQSACLKSLPEEKSGVASSTFYVGADVGQGIGPILAGAFIERVGADSAGYGSMFLSTSLIYLIGAAVFGIYCVKYFRKKQE